MKIKYLLILFLTQVLFANAGAIQETLSLSDAILKGLDKNFGIRISKENLRIAGNNNTWGMAGRYPTLTISAQSLNSWNNAPSSTDPDIRDEYRTHLLLPNINLSWKLFSGFSVSATKQKLELLNRISEGNSAVVVENTIQAIILSYYRVLLEQEKVKVLSELKKLSEDRLLYVETKKDLGAISSYEALQSKIAFLNDSANLAAQEINHRNSIRNLNLILGEESENGLELTDPFSVEMTDFKLDDLREKMFSGNNTLRNQYINLELLRKDLTLSRSALFPVVSLNTGIDGSRSSVKFPGISGTSSDSYDYYVNMSVSWTLFNGGRIRTAIKNAAISERIGNIRLDEMRFSLNNSLSSLYETYNLRKVLFKLAEEGLKSASLNLKISLDKYKSGSINSFNYRDVQLSYLNSALSRLQALFNIIETRTELMRITGGLIDQN